MNNLEQKKVCIKTEEDIKVVACQPLNNSETEEDFLDIDFTFKKNMALVGKCVYHNEGEGIVVIELEEPNLSVEFDLDLFNISPYKD